MNILFHWARAACCLSALVFSLGELRFAAAQETTVVPIAAKRCSCGRWTCPACQQQRLKQNCPPGQMNVPGAPGIQFTPGMQVNPGQQPAQGTAVPPGNINGGNVPPVSADGAQQFNLNDATAPSADASNAMSRLGQGTSDRGLFASNTGGLADPGMMGDFFGPTSSGSSILSQNFSVNATGIQDNGIYDFDVQPGGGNYPDISSSGPLSAGPTYTAPLAAPPSATDLPRPGEPGYTFAGGTAVFTGIGLPQGYFDPFTLNYSYQRELIIPSSFSQQRIKLAENTSPIPQNRIFMNYSMFDNVPLTSNGITVNRFSPGFESLLFSPNTSIEMRTPFATTLSSDLMLDGGTNTNNVEFGNMFFTFKQVLFRRNELLVSAGLSTTAPTADDVRVINGSGTEIVRINNDSVHVMPFVGFYRKLSQRTFVQGFTQVDVDVNGSRVFLNPDGSPNNLNQVGRIQDLTLLYLDMSAGHWVYRSNGRGLTGIAPMLEGHWNRSLNKADCIVDSNSGSRIQLPIQEYDNFNAVGAMVFEFNRRSRLAVGYAVPIGNGKDRAFDNELRVTFNRFF